MINPCYIVIAISVNISELVLIFKFAALLPVKQYIVYIFCILRSKYLIRNIMIFDFPNIAQH